MLNFELTIFENIIHKVWYEANLNDMLTNIEFNNKNKVKLQISKIKEET